MNIRLIIRTGGALSHWLPTTGSVRRDRGRIDFLIGLSVRFAVRRIEEAVVRFRDGLGG